MIVNLRGTSGAGKTSVIRELMERFGYEDVTVRGHNVVGIVVNPSGRSDTLGKIFVVGKYDNTCGGCDTIRSQDEVRRRIKKYAELGFHVIFEGLTIGNGYAKNLDLMRRLKARKGIDYAFAFLDTPLRTCLSRVRKRRKAAGNTKPFNTENTEKLYWSNLRFLMRAVKDRANPVVLDHEGDPASAVVALLEGVWP